MLFKVDITDLVDLRDDINEAIKKCQKINTRVEGIERRACKHKLSQETIDVIKEIFYEDK